MNGPTRVLSAGVALAAMMILTPLVAVAQAPVPVTFMLTIAGPSSGANGFDVHIDLPVSPQARALCVPAGTTSRTVSVCASGHTYTVVYGATEWFTVPYWCERVRNGHVVQTFAHGSVSAVHPATVRASFTFAGGVAVPTTGASAAAVVPISLSLLALGALLVVAVMSAQPVAQRARHRATRNRRR